MNILSVKMWWVAQTPDSSYFREAGLRTGAAAASVKGLSCSLFLFHTQSRFQAKTSTFLNEFRGRILRSSQPFPDWWWWVLLCTYWALWEHSQVIRRIHISLISTHMHRESRPLFQRKPENSKLYTVCYEASSAHSCLKWLIRAED